MASVYGGLLSIAMLTLVLCYASIKFEMLMMRDNPSISSFTEENILTSQDTLNLKDKNMRFAFSIEGFYDKELKNDPRYVKIIMRLAGKKNGENVDTLLDYHMCTEEDFREMPNATDDD